MKAQAYREADAEDLRQGHEQRQGAGASESVCGERKVLAAAARTGLGRPSSLILKQQEACAGKGPSQGTACQKVITPNEAINGVIAG